MEADASPPVLLLHGLGEMGLSVLLRIAELSPLFLGLFHDFSFQLPHLHEQGV